MIFLVIYFRETGRPDEAADEGKLALKQNVFSWTSLKTLCNLGVGNPENIYTNLLTCVNEARSVDKPKTSKRYILKLAIVNVRCTSTVFYQY